MLLRNLWVEELMSGLVVTSFDYSYAIRWRMGVDPNERECILNEFDYNLNYD